MARMGRSRPGYRLIRRFNVYSTVTTSVNAGAGSADGSANSPSLIVAAAGGAAASSAAALTPTPTVSVAAGEAAAAGAANPPTSVASAPRPGAASATSVANTAAATVATSTDEAPGTAAAYDVVFPVTPSYPVVASTSSGTTGVGATQVTTTLPSGVAAGDLLVLFVARLNALATTDPSGWTRLSTDSTHNGAFEAWYRRYQAGDSAPTVTGPSGTAWAYRMLRVTGAHTSTAPELAALAPGTSTSPNPPALNPANWDVEATLWVAVA